MNPQMMQYGNQPGGYSQSGNYTGSYSPPGGGPPPPGNNPSLGNFPPTASQFTQSAPSSSTQLKNLSMPPNSLASASFNAPSGSQVPQGGPLGFHPQHPMQGPGPLGGPPECQPYQGVQNSEPANGPPGSLSQHSGPTNGPPTSHLPHAPQGFGPVNGPPSSASVSQSSGPPLSGHPRPLGPPTSQPATNQSHFLSGPPGPPSSNTSIGRQQYAPSSSTTSVGSQQYGPPSSTTTSSSQQYGPPLSTISVGNQQYAQPSSTATLGSQQYAPPSNTTSVGSQQYGPSQINGSPSTMPMPSGQMDPGRQYVNGPQNQLPGVPGGPPMQQRPPMGFSSPGQMLTPPTGSMKSMYHPVSSISQQNLSGPPFPQSQQTRQSYSPGSLNKDNYPGAPAPLHQQEMRPGYPPVGQGHYQQMNQPYSGLNQNYSSMSSPSYPQQPQQKTQRKLDTDMLPGPIQVMQDDEKNRSGIFYTDQKGLMPPLVTTNFLTQDQGNCSPRFLRSTMYNVPVTADLLKQTNVPFSLLISPLARTVEGEQPPPIVNMGELGPVRCIRCKAYMSPFMQFIDGGRRFHCVFCKATTEVPAEYFQHLDHTGQRVDRFERPELVLGAYEFIATKDYCRNNQPAERPAMIFVIDVSYNNVKSGLVHLLCSKMKEIIKCLPRDEGLELSSMKVGFITYSTGVHFYNIKSCLAAPQMLLVGDVNEMFMPLLDGFLCDPVESEAVIDLLMQEIPKQFAETRETETILYPAIQAGLEALKASGCAGKLLVFHSSLPIGEAPGKLKNRDDRKVLNTEKEKTVLTPQNNSYNNLGQECVQAGCSVDLFIFNNSYVDIATIGEVSRLTGGEIFKYTYFQADIDGDRFITDLKRNVSRQIAFDAIMRVRTSTGVRPTEFYGHFFMSNTKDMELASIDCDKAVAVEIKHDDKLTEEDGVFIQVALLYTSCGGQRRLRILNLSLKTCSQMADLYRCCDLDTLMNYLAKQGIFKLLEGSPKQVKTNIMNRCANILACYRKNCANPSSTGQLILPECMKLLPLYVNTLLKSDAFSGGSDITCDDRSFVMHYVMIMDLTVSVVYFYPRLIPLHNVDPDSLDIPLPIRCTYEKLQEDGVYLLDNGIHMFMWLGLNASTSFISNVFGVPTAPQVDTDKQILPALDNPLSLRIRNLIDEIRKKRHRSMRLTILKQRDKMEMVFKQYLMEDHGADGSPSYADFLCHMHSQIRTILS